MQSKIKFKGVCRISKLNIRIWDFLRISKISRISKLRNIFKIYSWNIYLVGINIVFEYFSKMKKSSKITAFYNHFGRWLPGTLLNLFSSFWIEIKLLYFMKLLRIVTFMALNMMVHKKGKFIDHIFQFFKVFRIISIFFSVFFVSFQSFLARFSKNSH